MRSVYEETRIPLQIRRLMIFTEICRKARKYPDDMVYLDGYSTIAFGVIYSTLSDKYTAFTKEVRTPLGLLINWNNYTRNRSYYSLSNDIQYFFPINDELELDYPPHKFYERLVANAALPLWDNGLI